MIKIIISIIAIIILFTVSSCAEIIKKPQEILDEKSCITAGGKWKIWKDLPNAKPECNLPTSDAGKQCTDSSQCESYCEAPQGAEVGSKATGKCYSWKLWICQNGIVNGIVNPPACY